MKRPVLIINSYAGSLTVAATQAGHPVAASLEDAGYGLEIQRLNFPRVSYHPTVASWPDRSWAGHVALAHPPCAAFSRQNNSPQKQGIACEKFQQTIKVIEYAAAHQADAICVESVPRALTGAATVHEGLARDRGYDLYRVLQNSVTFGLTQWRPRFWCVFVRKGLLPQLILTHRPTIRLVDDVVRAPGPRTLDPRMVEWTTLQVEKLKKVCGPAGADTILNGEDSGLVFDVAARATGFEGIQAEKKAKFGYPGHGFNSSHLRILSPVGFASTLLYDAWWWVAGHGLLAREDYLDIMGFPRDYKFPVKLAHRFREFLSRGVCPPVARWILEQVNLNLSQKVKALGTPPETQVLHPGEVANFLVEEDFRERARQRTI